MKKDKNRNYISESDILQHESWNAIKYMLNDNITPYKKQGIISMQITRYIR